MTGADIHCQADNRDWVLPGADTYRWTVELIQHIANGCQEVSLPWSSDQRILSFVNRVRFVSGSVYISLSMVSRAIIYVGDVDRFCLL